RAHVDAMCVGVLVVGLERGEADDRVLVLHDVVDDGLDEPLGEAQVRLAGLDRLLDDAPRARHRLAERALRAATLGRQAAATLDRLTLASPDSTLPRSVHMLFQA